jgi:hypothetical protein
VLLEMELIGRDGTGQRGRETRKAKFASARDADPVAPASGRWGWGGVG